MMRLLCLAVTFFAIIGCERTGRELEDQVVTSRVRIISLTPSTEVDLVAGRPVRMSVTAEYNLASNVGQISAVVQTAEGTPVTQAFDVVKSGQGTATIAVEFVVPKTSSIKIFVPIVEEGQVKSSSLDSRAYRVVSVGSTTDAGTRIHLNQLVAFDHSSPPGHPIVECRVQLTQTIDLE